MRNKLNITNIKSTFGYIGFLPFATFSLIPWIIGGDISKTMIVFQLGYGAIIITFLGGFAWGWNDDQKNQPLNLSIGIGFSLLGCAILLLAYLNFILTGLILSIGLEELISHDKQNIKNDSRILFITTISTNIGLTNLLAESKKLILI